MATFSDDFNRADGPPGPDWVLLNGDPAISGNAVYVQANDRWRPVLSSGSGDHTVSTDTHFAGNWPQGYVLMVKASADLLNGYFCYTDSFYGTPTLFVGYRSGGDYTALAQTAWVGGFNTWTSLQLEWTAGTLTATWGGVIVASAVDSDHIGGEYVGLDFKGLAGLWDNFTTGVVDPVTLDVQPDPLWIGGGPVSCTATLANAAWTIGVPGSATLSADHGAVSDQVTDTTTTMRFTYTPAEYVGPIVFTESDFGAQDTVNSTVVPQEGQGGVECRLTADGASMINTTAAHTSGDLTTTDTLVVAGQLGEPDLLLVQAIRDLWYAEFRTDVNPPSGMTGDSILYKLWLIINGGWDPAVGPWPEPGASTLKQDTQGAVTSLLELRGELSYTLADTIAAVKGLDNRSITQVYDLVDGLQVGSNQDVLDMLSLMWGASTPTLTDIATLITDLSTIAGYTLGDVLDAIAAQDVHGHTEQVLAAIAALRGVDGHTVSEVYNLVDTVNTAVQEVKVSLQEIRAPGSYTLQDVLDAIAAIPPAEDSGTPGPPAWPGLAGVTLGPQWPLSTGLTLAGPMDGVVIEIAAVAPKFNGHFYTYHDVRCYRNVGALAFVSDRGDVETYQALGFTEAIYTPRTMTRAAAVKLMCPAGTAGSIRAWTINP